MSALFTPLTLRGLTLPNRVWLSAMCQYSADDGVPTDWHLVHLGARAVGGFGLILTEATAVTAEGRGSLRDTGLYTDAQVAGWRRIVEFAHRQGTLIGVQLGHTGRKSSARIPWEGAGSLPTAEGGWAAVAPSAVPFADLSTPRALTVDEIGELVEAFGAAAGRAVAAGFDVVEIHAATGIWRINSCHRWPTGAPTPTAGRSTTASAFSARSPGRSVPAGRPTGRCWSGCRPPTGSTAAGPPPRPQRSPPCSPTTAWTSSTCPPVAWTRGS